MLNEWATENADFTRSHKEPPPQTFEEFANLIKESFKRKKKLKLSHFTNEINDYLNNNSYLHKEFVLFMTDSRFRDPFHIANIQFAYYVLTKIFGERPYIFEINYNKEMNCYVYNTSRYTYCIPFEILDIESTYNLYKFIRVKNHANKRKDNWVTQKLDHLFGLDKKYDYDWKSESELTDVLDLPPKGYEGQENWIISYLVFTRLSSLVHE